MPRTSRAIAIGYPHHVTQRGNNRQQVFFDDQDRLVYHQFLLQYTRKYQVDIWAYCLMPNHVHLLAVPHVHEGLARAVGLSSQCYTRFVHRKYLRSGRVWQNRYFSCIVDTDEHLWTVARYIEMNQVRAGLVEKAEDYQWSSAACHLLGTQDPLLRRSTWLAADERQAYRAFLLDDDKRQTKALEQATRSGRPFCGVATLRRLEAQLGRCLC
jgi:putative transposase